MTDADHVLKIVLCGAFGSGKTSLATRFARNSFAAEYKATIGVEFYVRVVQGPLGSTYKLHIWDTSGQERYASLMPQWFRGAQACCFLFNVCDRDSFDAVPYWVEQAAAHAGTDATVRVLVATQTDRAAAQRVVDRDEATHYASSRTLHYAETSALTGDGVDELFRTIVELRSRSAHGPRHDPEPQQQLTLEESVLLTQQQQPQLQRRKNCMC
jgi:small GTP-binding protein